MRILVTGGAGFLGSHLCELLIARGDSVVCLDDLSTGCRENIHHLTGPRFAYIEGSVLTPIDIDGDFDGVVHLASPASPQAYLARPIFTLRTGSEGTRHVLEFACAKAARFILASTSEIYGDPLVHPQREDYWGNVNPVGPRSVYDESKRYAPATSTPALCGFSMHMVPGCGRMTVAWCRASLIKLCAARRSLCSETEAKPEVCATSTIWFAASWRC